ncbi:MAG: glycosyltransferase [Candidatus Omnitrophota bacterium]|nr:glycosyltransferase [Candidatus Omnitrophota bacterium]MDZ4241679.1 glycosyltransferase [Candidatus Omnitrophota bacterium]
MRILFIAPRCPLPADTGGKIRTLNILKQVARRCEVHFVYFAFEETDARQTEEFRRMNVATTAVSVSETGLMGKAWSVIADPMPYSTRKYLSRAMARAVEALVRSQKFDFVHVDHIHMAHYRAQCADAPCLVDEHNVEYKILERCALVEKSLLKRALYGLQAAKMRRFEARAIAGFQACAAVSEDDAALLRQLCRGEVPVYVIPNGVDTEYFQSEVRGQQPEEEALVFTGSMDWLPNDDAMAYFIQDILPLVWKARPSVKLYIVGKDPSEQLRQWARQDSRIVVTGRVEDVRPFMDRAAVFITPLRIGGGTRLKILEAMSMQKAVVSTTIGAEGIEYQDGVHLSVADSPEAFRDNILALLADGKLRKFLGEQGRRLVVGKYDWNIVGEKLTKIYGELIHDKK